MISNKMPIRTMTSRMKNAGTSPACPNSILDMVENTADITTVDKKIVMIHFMLTFFFDFFFCF